MSRGNGNISPTDLIEIHEMLADGSMSHAMIAAEKDLVVGTIHNISSRDRDLINEIVMRNAEAIKTVYLTQRTLRVRELASLYVPQKDAFLRESEKDEPNPILLKKISAQCQSILLQIQEESGDRLMRSPNEGPPAGPVDWNITLDPESVDAT
jgi:hypothetical protein